MGNTLPLARLQEDISTRRVTRTRRPNRHSKLLDEGGSGVSSRTSLRRNKRKKTATTSKGAKTRSAKDTKAKSSVSAEVENLDGSTSERKGHRHSNKNRQPDRGAEGADRTPRRSASELDIEWIGSFCPDGQPHHLIGIHNFDGGCLFKCTGCKKHQWLPTIMTEAASLDRMIDYLGAEAGYHKYLDKHREAKMMVAKLQNLWYARQRIGDDGEFMNLVVAVMDDKEYDKKEGI